MPEELYLDNPVAIIGDEDVVAGFRALGFRAFPVKTAADCNAALDEVVNNKIAVCLLQDNFYVSGKDKIAGYANLPLPVFLPFSMAQKADTLGDMVKNIRLRATGVVEK